MTRGVKDKRREIKISLKAQTIRQLDALRDVQGWKGREELISAMILHRWQVHLRNKRKKSPCEPESPTGSASPETNPQP